MCSLEQIKTSFQIDRASKRFFFPDRYAKILLNDRLYNISTNCSERVYVYILYIVMDKHSLYCRICHEGKSSYHVTIIYRSTLMRNNIILRKSRSQQVNVFSTLYFCAIIAKINDSLYYINNISFDANNSINYVFNAFVVKIVKFKLLAA